jgi:cysteine-rich repeat protein
MLSLPLFALPALILGCGDDAQTTVTDSGTGSSSLPSTDVDPSAGTAMTTAPTSTATEGTGSATGSGTSTTSVPTSTTATDSDPATSTPDTSSSTNPPETTTTTTISTSETDATDTAISVSTSSTGDPPMPVCGNGIQEMGEACDDGDQIDKNACSNTCMLVPCDEQEGGMGGFDFSYIWIANSPQGTVSKVDTVLLQEVGRFYTDTAVNSSPSRTAVNVDGRFAAVANRTGGGVTVFASDPDECVDKNGNGMIETSTGAGDIKAWGTDECQLWSVKVNPNPNNDQKGPRPLGWDFADQDPQTCEYLTHTLWVGWYSLQNIAYFWHLDQDGNMLGEVQVPAWNNVQAWGPYGGAVDKNHDFWVTGWHGPLVRINAADLTYDMWNDPILENVDAYGFALDRQGDPWFGGCGGSVVTFNTQNETFLNVGSPGGCLRGLQVDAKDRGWIARNGGACLIQVDTVNNTIVNANINLPGCQTVVGVSIDIEGFVWVVDQGGRAYKVNPDTLATQTVMGFNSPYTYSDMTGAGIRLQAMPQ